MNKILMKKLNIEKINISASFKPNIIYSCAFMCLSSDINFDVQNDD